MNEHPINGLMESAMDHLKGMIDVNTIVGEPVQTPDGTVIIPISKVGFGFATGGSDFPNKNSADTCLFGGGSGAGVSITPVAFLVVGKDQIQMLPIGEAASVTDKLVSAIPNMFDKVNNILKERKAKKTAKSQFDEV